MSNSYEKVKELNSNACKLFLEYYSDYISAFSKYDIHMTMKPCYYYNGKFKTEMRKKGCYTVYRIRLFPKGLTYVQATKKHMYKEFFSRKIFQFKITSHNIYKINTFSKDDIILERFLKHYLYKAKKLYQQTNEPIKSLKESGADIINSICLIYRYRTEVKSTFYGFDLNWLLLLIIVIAILLRIEAHLRLLGT